MEEQKNFPQKEKTNYKKLIIIIVIVVALIGGVGWQFVKNTPLNPFTPQQPQLADIGPDDPVVRVNGEEFTRADLDVVYTQLATRQGVNPTSLDTASQQQLLTQSLNSLVQQALIKQQIEGANITVTDEEISTQLENIRGQFETEEEFQQTLTQQAITEAQLREQIRTELRTQQYLNNELNFDEITVTEEEINSAYTQAQENSEEEVPPLEEVRADVEQTVRLQKQQARIAEHLQELQSQADIELLI